MPDFLTEYLAEVTQGTWSGVPPQSVQGFHFDTRKLRAGDCFIALTGESRDGHDFLPEALSMGASSAITSRKLDCALPQLLVADPLTALAALASDLRQRFGGPVVGISGSCGKTSSKEMLRLLLGEASTHATPGNWNNRIGVPMTLLDLDPERHRFAVIEAGINQPGEMALLGAMVQADLTLFTHIGPAHLELLGSLNGIAEEKSQLALRARPDSPIILPATLLDYPAFAALAERCIAVRWDEQTPAVRVRQMLDWRVDSGSSGAASTLQMGEQAFTVKSVSEGMIQNAALAITAAQMLGVSAEDCAERISQWSPERTRGQTLRRDGAYFYIDCYNANPASMMDAIRAFQKSAPPELPRCYVLGAMDELGASAMDYHQRVGAALILRPEDSAVCIGPEALTEAYRIGLEQNAPASSGIRCCRNAVEAASVMADYRGALFLKGSRSYQLETLLPPSI